MVDWDGFESDDPADYSEFVPSDNLFDDLPDYEYLGRAYLLPDGSVYADAYALPDTDFRHVSFDTLDSFFDRDRDDEQMSWTDFAKDVPFGFDRDDPDIRGPFPSEDDVNNFINETGLWWADIYYDDDTDTYFVDVSY